MNRAVTEHPAFTLHFTAHEDAERRLLMATVEVGDFQPDDPSLNVAIVIDRSGSMSGRPIEITTAAVARFIRSLAPNDKVGVVTYDDRVDMVSGMTPPTEALAQQVERIRSGGSTNLYGGWLMGAKLVGAGGRVILLSDGLANVGRYTDADNLSNHAGLSYRRFQVSTTTIGIGESYDEALMSGMARDGGGSHYFASTIEAVMDAFSRERAALGTVALQQVSLRYQGQTLQLGHLTAGEKKSVVFQINGLQGAAPTLRFTDPSTGKMETLALRLPEGFGHDDEVTLEWLFSRVAQVEEEIVRVRDPRSASTAREAVRTIMLKLLAHPKSDEEQVQAVVRRLEGRIERLTELERDYDESRAVYERKHSLQFSHNLRNRAQAYSAFEEDQPQIEALHCMASASPMPVSLVADPDGLALAPFDRWVAWVAVPIELSGRHLRVAMQNPKDGFLVSDIEKQTKRKVLPVPVPFDVSEILQALGR